MNYANELAISEVTAMSGFPEFLKSLPKANLGVEGIDIHVLKGEQSVAFFEITKDVTVPLHKHGAQWGVVIAGELELNLEGAKRVLKTGDNYFIPAQAMHGAEIKKGTRLLEFYEEADRFS